MSSQKGRNLQLLVSHNTYGGWEPSTPLCIPSCLLGCRVLWHRALHPSTKVTLLDQEAFWGGQRWWFKGDRVGSPYLPAACFCKYSLRPCSGLCTCRLPSS